MSAGQLQSLFTQKLDRALFASYFLGAVVPILALGYVVQRFALPSVDDDIYATALLLGPVAGIGFLSLVAFFALRRISFTAMTLMDADRNRLEAILEVSRGLATAQHVHAAGSVAVGCAHRLTGADIVLMLTRSEPGKPLSFLETAGEGVQALLETSEEDILELAEGAIAAGGVGAQVPLESGLALSIPMCSDAGAVGAFILVQKTLQDAAAHAFAPEILDAMETLAGLTAVAVQSAEFKDSQQNFFTHTIEIVVTALNAHIGDRTGGVHRIAQMANRIGRELGLEEEALRRLHFASLLCDIGMLKLSSAQLKSPKYLAKHAVLGHRMLCRIRMWEMLAEIVLHHHDRYDEGRGAEVPLESRIIQVAEALTCASSGELTTPAQALVDLTAERGGRFDPSVVSAVERLVERGDLGD